MSEEAIYTCHRCGERMFEVTKDLHKCDPAKLTKLAMAVYEPAIEHLYHVVFWQDGLAVAKVEVVERDKGGAWVKDLRDGTVYVENRQINDHYDVTPEGAVYKDWLWHSRHTDSLLRNAENEVEHLKAIGELMKSKDCTCRLVTMLPDGTKVFGGIDACPVHGLGTE